MKFIFIKLNKLKISRADRLLIFKLNYFLQCTRQQYFEGQRGEFVKIVTFLFGNLYGAHFVRWLFRMNLYNVNCAKMFN